MTVLANRALSQNVALDVKTNTNSTFLRGSKIACTVLDEKIM
jgi:hypothetical protein